MEETIPTQPISVHDYLRNNIAALRQQKAETEAKLRTTEAHLHQITGALAASEQLLAGLREGAAPATADGA